jgi:hypothetical protein
MWIIEAHQPRVLVELCVTADNTYCGFLQAIRALSLETKCFGFSIAAGPASGSARNGDFDALKTYHDPLYGTFSTLRRVGIADALSAVADGSIDLLEISAPLADDGPFGDLDAWLPKMSARGVILVQGLEVRPHGSGIRAFWERLSLRHPHVVFTHGAGLGVAYAGSEPLSEPLQVLLDAREQRDVAGIRSYFARLGTSVAERFALRQAESLAQFAARAETGHRPDVPELQKLIAQRDSLTRILRQQSLTVIRLERELNRSLVLRMIGYLFQVLVPPAARRYIRRQLPLEKMSRLARGAPAGLKRHIPLSLKQFLARQLSSG